MTTARRNRVELLDELFRTRARAAIYRASAEALRPDVRRSVVAWADAERIMPPGVSPRPGRWSTATVPYLREPMECLSLAHPARRVSLLKSAQLGGSECGVNLLGQVMAENPQPCLVVVPAKPNATQYDDEKLAPMIEACPSVARQVRPVVSRNGGGSTKMRKALPGGGFVQMAVASTSRSLQSRSVRVLILEEISEYPFDVDGRGDPVNMAEARTIAYTRNRKIFDCSTPGTKGRCRVTDLWARGSRGRYLVPCPHCAHEQALVFTQLRWPEGRPQLAEYHCEGCGAGIRPHQKAAMVAAGRWQHERPELVLEHASFAINTLYSPFVPWGDFAKTYEEAVGKPDKFKAFTQQYLGEAWEDKHDLPAEGVLFARRELWPEGRVPPGVLFLTGAVDVQGDRLEWAVWGFDRGFTSWRVDGGVLAGDPTQGAVWAELHKITLRAWRDSFGRELQPAIWGVDSGFLSQRVYAFCAGREQGAPGVPPVIALDGRPGWGAPAMGVPTVRDIDAAGRKVGSVRAWPVGTWDLKTELAQALRLTEVGPTEGVWPEGAVRLSTALDMDRLQQLTAETCKPRELRTGHVVREWVKIRSRNEELDLAVYCRALARQQAAGLVDAQWRALEAQRLAPPPGTPLAEGTQGDLAGLWTPGLRAAALEAQRELEAREAAEAAARRQAETMPPPPAAPWGDAPAWGAAQW